MAEVNFKLDDCEKYDCVFLSLGAGLQSSVMYYMACMGFDGMPKIDFAIFSDTEDEPQHTYKTLEDLIKYGKQTNGPEIVVINKLGKLSAPMINKNAKRISSIPAFTKNEDGTVSMIRRQCTPDYKIEPIKRYAKEYLGIKKGERMGQLKILALQGITTDEATRMKAPQDKWYDHGYPLCTMRMSRYDCELWLAKYGFDKIEKSACVYCPYHGNDEWRRIKENKKDWLLACEVDDAIRDSSCFGINSPLYLHRSVTPLREVDLGSNDNDLFQNECDGYCGL